jgi:hypothetical protein
VRISIVAALFVASFSIGGVAHRSAAQSPEGVRVATANPAVDHAPKFTFILFWKEDNAATQGMTAALKTAVAKRSQRAEWTSVNIRDEASRAVVERYKVERAPMPLVICIAANGAITGAMARQISDDAIEHALVTPAMTQATKALQDKKIVVVHVQQDALQPLPAGAADFLADPAFQERTTTVNVLLGDPAESRFVSEMKIKAVDVADSMVVLLAPPGVLVGKFPADATAAQIAAALHAAGKCCDDPNCKHNQKGQ